MKLQKIILIISLLSFISATTGGYLYYSSVTEKVDNEIHIQSDNRIKTIKNNLITYLSRSINTVKTLAGIEDIRICLDAPNQENIGRANRVLDHFKNTLNVDVCYLLNGEGITIASSNRGLDDSFMGKNFSFRPYFKDSFKGKPISYLALGTTSQKRGAFYGYPVYGLYGNKIIGVVVIKASIEPVEKSISQGDDNIVVVTNPLGVVFISSKKSWRFKTLWKLSKSDHYKVKTSRQFGSGPWDPVGIVKTSENKVKDKRDQVYLLNKSSLKSFPGWEITYFLNLNSFYKKFAYPFLRIPGLITFILIISIALVVFILYKQATHEIRIRIETEDALVESKDRYRTIYHNTPAMLHSINNDGKIVSISDHWIDVMGYERDEVLGKTLFNYLDEESRDYAREVIFPEFYKKGFCRDVSYRFVKKNGEKMDVLLSAFGERDKNGRIVRSLAVSIDVTEQKKSKEALRIAKESLSIHSKNLERQVRHRTREITNLIKYTPDVVYIKDRNGRYILVNSRFEKIFGVTSDEIKGKSDEEIFPPDIAGHLILNDKKIFDSKKSSLTEESIIKGLDRTYLTVRFPIYDRKGEISGIGGISTDISELKETQSRLKKLSSGIMERQEQERSTLARELHDELGQILTAIRLDSVWMVRRFADSDPEASDRARLLCNLVDDTIKEVRGLAFRLRPGVLDDLGLIDALEWLTGDFERRTQTTCIFHHENIPSIQDGIDEAVLTAFYRIAQEALTNVTRHAEAKNVEVKLKKDSNNNLLMTISDDGKGVDPEHLNLSEGLGVVGIKERADLLGGVTTVSSKPSKGTVIHCKIPI